MENCTILRPSDPVVSKLLQAMDTLALINSTQNLDMLAKIILQSVREVMEVEASSLAQVDTVANELFFSEAAGGSEKIMNLRLKMGEGIAGHVAETGAPMIVNDVRNNKYHYSNADVHTSFRTRSILCVPLIVRGNVIGVLQALNKIDNSPFNENDLRIFNAFANQAAVALENARLYKMAIYDGLTGIYDRRYIDAWLKHEYNRVVRCRSNFSLILFDLDHFKRINDNFGHQAGDRILVSLVTKLGEIVRKSDLFARYGGEEFIIVLPDTDLVKACDLAEKYRAHLEQEVFQYEGNRISVTISAGIVNYKKNPVSSIDEFIKIADERLYKAKGLGRNMVCWK